MDYMKNHKKPRIKDSEIIRASEIGQFCFCSISWYLQKCGYRPKSQFIEIGRKKHEDLGKIIELSIDKSKKSNVFSLAGYLFLILGIIVIIFEVIL
jgi:hypothetical protein